MGEPRTYVLKQWMNNRAKCQCGFEGKARWWRGAAVLDVLNHCREFGHMPVDGLQKQRTYSF